MNMDHPNTIGVHPSLRTFRQDLTTKNPQSFLPHSMRTTGLVLSGVNKLSPAEDLRRTKRPWLNEIKLDPRPEVSFFCASVQHSSTLHLIRTYVDRQQSCRPVAHRDCNTILTYYQKLLTFTAD